MTSEEIAKKIATEIVCEGCVSVIPVMCEKCKEDPCGTWYDGYRCALKALEEYART